MLTPDNCFIKSCRMARLEKVKEKGVKRASQIYQQIINKSLGQLCKLLLTNVISFYLLLQPKTFFPTLYSIICVMKEQSHSLQIIPSPPKNVTDFPKGIGFYPLWDLKLEKRFTNPGTTPINRI